MPFDHFDPRAHKRLDPPVVHIEKGIGRFLLNQAAYDQIGRPPFAELMYDPELLRIGFRPSWQRTPRSFALTKASRSHSRRITAQSFGHAFGISRERSTTFAATFEDGVLVIDLKSQSAVHEEEPATDVAIAS